MYFFGSEIQRYPKPRVSKDVISLKAYVPGSDSSAFEGFRGWRTGLALMSVMVRRLEGRCKG